MIPDFEERARKLKEKLQKKYARKKAGE